MIELLLNAVWIAVAGGAFLAAPRRSARTLVALAFALVLLFPIISVSDDLGGSLEEAIAVMVVVFALLIGLVALARVLARDEHVALVVLATPSDPRSPPRR